MIPKTHARIALGVLALGLVALAAAVAAVGRDAPHTIPASALNDQSRFLGAAPPDTRNLAEAVERWNNESRTRWNTAGAGRPVVAKTTRLLTNVGRERDSLTAFPTSEGAVCFEVKAAGTCGRLDTPTGVIWAVLSTRGSTRLFGVAADGIERLQVDVNGNLGEATLRNNGFFYEFAPGASSEELRAFHTTWTDGSTQVFDPRAMGQ